MHNYTAITQLFVRLCISIGFIYPGLDRFGAWGPHGAKGVYWGDWQHFTAYAQQLLFFLPAKAAEVLAMLATVSELCFATCLLLGLFTRFTAVGSGFLVLLFALCMSIALGPSAPIGYSVFSLSAACFMLACLPEYHWSFDQYFTERRQTRACFSNLSK